MPILVRLCGEGGNIDRKRQIWCHQWLGHSLHFQIKKTVNDFNCVMLNLCNFVYPLKFIQQTLANI